MILGSDVWIIRDLLEAEIRNSDRDARSFAENGKAKERDRALSDYSHAKRLSQFFSQMDPY